MIGAFKVTLVLTLAILSSIFLIKGKLGLATKDIAELSRSKWGYNLNVAQSLCKQQADTQVGFIFIVSCWIMQFFNLIAQKGIYLGYDKRGVFATLIVTILLYFLAVNLSNYFFKQSYNQAKIILEAKE